MTQEPLRILHLIKGLGLGGAERALEHGFRYADSGRFELTYGYFLEDKNALVGNLEELGARVTPIPVSGSAGLLLAVRRAARLARQCRADLIHAHLPLSGVVGRLAGRRANLPVVYTEHSQHERHHRWSRFLNRRTWRLQREVIAVSKAVASSIERAVGDAVPVTLIPNGVPVDQLRTDPELGHRLRAELGLDQSAPLIGQIAVFRREKRLHRWLEAAARISARRPDCRFLLVGDGPLRADLKARCAELNLDRVVAFPGLLHDVRPALSAMDLLLISSRFEGLPLALLEAMATGLPVVSTRAGGVAEAIIEGETGLLASDGSSEELAMLTLSLIEDRERRLAFGRAAAERAETRFSARLMQNRIENIYRKVLGR